MCRASGIECEYWFIHHGSFLLRSPLGRFSLSNGKATTRLRQVATSASSERCYKNLGPTAAALELHARAATAGRRVSQQKQKWSRKEQGKMKSSASQQQQQQKRQHQQRWTRQSYIYMYRRLVVAALAVDYWLLLLKLSPEVEVATDAGHGNDYTQLRHLLLLLLYTLFESLHK